MKESKYGTRWQSADGRRLILEDIETEHLLNCYKHILNNFMFYVGWFMGQTGCNQRQAEDSVFDMRKEFKTELLYRGVDEHKIENWIEDKSRLKIHDK